MQGINICWLRGPSGLGRTKRDTSHGGDTIDVALTDLSMSQMDGLELLAETRDRWPESRVVVHSSMMTGRVLRLARLVGAYACLSKSYDTAQFLETIASASSAA